MMDCRVEPGNDESISMKRETTKPAESRCGRAFIVRIKSVIAPRSPVR
jgi:hypothetical protein